MLFGVLRITPQLKLQSAQCAPGSLLEGTIYVTCTSKEPVVVKEIWAKFEGDAALRGNVTYNRVSSTAVRNDWDAIEPDVAACSPAGPNAAPQAVGDTNPEAAKIIEEDTRPKTDNLSLYLARAAVCVRSEPTEFAQGVHAVPFAIEVPYEYKGVLLPSSFDAPELGLYVKYSVVAVLKLASLVQRTDKQRVRLVHPNPPIPAEQALKATLTVGTWDKESTRPWQALKYYFGRNTTIRESEVVATASLRDLNLKADSSAFLHDSLRLTVAPANGVVSEQLFVDCVRVELVSEVLDRSRGFVASRHFYTIINAKKVGFPIAFATSDSEVDISAILSGARIPSLVAPTFHIPGIQVQHWLHVRIGLRSKSPDGTRQGVAHRRLEMPLQITFA